MVVSRQETKNLPLLFSPAMDFHPGIPQLQDAEMQYSVQKERKKESHRICLNAEAGCAKPWSKVSMSGHVVPSENGLHGNLVMKQG